MRHAWVLAMLLCPLAVPAMAGTGYKCVDAAGHVSYQDTPCARGERQTVLHLPAPRANVPEPVAAPAPTPPPPVPTPAPAPPIARVAPPVLYRCMPATGGAAYLSRNGHPRSYLVPFGVLGGITVPLAQAYGAQQGPTVGMTAPELMRRPPPALIGSRYVRVRDACYRLPPAAACDALEKRNDANDEAIRQAFRDERAPLLKKRARLHAELAGCRF